MQPGASSSNSDENSLRLHKSSANSTIVFAPDSFKGTVAASEAARLLAAGWASVRPADTLVLKPMADGGEGTLDALDAAVAGCRRMPVRVTGPDDEVVDASWLLFADGTGIVELACTSGLTLLAELRAADAHTRGFGQAICAALDYGVDRLVLAIGGSSSTDAGAGVLSELGARLQDAAGQHVRPGNRGLRDLGSLDLSTLRPLPARGVSVLCDVTNPLLGDSGAAAIYGPQKGASTSAEVLALERALSRFSRVVADLGGSVDPAHPGAGAAGGTGFGLMLWGADLEPGSAVVAEVSGLADALGSAAAVVTGEGSFDGQSAAGKVVSHVLDLAVADNVPALLVSGRVEAPTDRFADVVDLSELAGSGVAAISDASYWLEMAGARLAARF